MLTFQHVLKALLGRAVGELDFKLPEAFIDSRAVSEGSLFFALRGERTDGHLYVDDAFARGASLAILEHPIESAYPIVELNAAELQFPERPPFSLLTDNVVAALQKLAAYWRAQFDIKVIGITGSVGKSSTKELTANVLSKRLVTLKNPGNMNNEIGMPLSLLSLNAEHEVAVLEMGFYVPGEIKLLCEIARPQIGIVTNIGTVHAERAGSIEAIAEGKSELVQALPPAPEGVAILNYDDERVLAMAAKTSARVFTYGLCPQADLWADQVESMGLEGIRCRIHYQGEDFYVTAPLIGRHSVYTMLRSAAAALSLGFSWDWIFYALKTSNLQLRIATTKTASGALLIDDTYNASPDSTLAALNLLEDLTGLKVAVLGDMLELGTLEASGHAQVGREAAGACDLLVTVGARAALIAEAALEHGLPPSAVMVATDRHEAIAHLSRILQAGDTVLIKGSRAMQMEEIVAALQEATS